MTAHAHPAAGLPGRAGLAVSAAVLALGLTNAAPAQDKTAGAAADGDAFVTEAYELCRDVALGLGSAPDALDAAGWSYEIDPYGEQPYYQDLDGTKSFPGIGDADMWAFLEFYPTHTLGYCHVEIFSPDATVDFSALDGHVELVGESQTLDGITYGAWEEDDPVPVVFVRADTDGRIYVQVTSLVLEQ